MRPFQKLDIRHSKLQCASRCLSLTILPICMCQIMFANNLELNSAFQEISLLFVRGLADMLGSEIGEMPIQTKSIIGSRHDHMIVDIEVDTANGLPFEEYKARCNRVSHPIIHNVSNPQKDILQPQDQEEEEVVPAHEPQYIMRLRGYEDQLVSAVQASTTMLAEELTLRQKWYLEVYNRVNNAFEMLSKFVPVNMVDIEAMIEILQR
ncbi:hypothetical protein AMTR_s00054p00045760 [Amborella trichopoda]|uniref:Uncharacterized protein n=1 Tax=Amborella trichopoda TaxID=13333 RepID=U5D9N1_AMBTC|nr:hypothetical protein AMTR_s00054p00045760 [Amborella trichopoda]